nr:MAG TPA: hypothetical protein [Caudoviricetes sp.]
MLLSFANTTMVSPSMQINYTLLRICIFCTKCPSKSG